MQSAISASGWCHSREAFRAWYETREGQRLQEQEALYLGRALRISYGDFILQIGCVGWENTYIKEDCCGHFGVVDHSLNDYAGCNKLITTMPYLPLESDSIDYIIAPHALEFVDEQCAMLEEIERVLKPEGCLLLLGFNPCSFYGLCRFVPRKRKQAPWNGHFMSGNGLLDRLNALNFESEISARFYLKPVRKGINLLAQSYVDLWAIGYAIKAIKRRYNLIPLAADEEAKAGFAWGNIAGPSSWRVSQRK